jgi:hypothetical protein
MMSAAIGVLVLLAALLALAWPRALRWRRKGQVLKQRTLDRKRPGEMYIAAECCTSCGVPALIAPELFEDGAPVCRVKRQPQTVTELRRALRVFRQQDLSCVRYRGAHSRVRHVLSKVGCGVHADLLPLTPEKPEKPAPRAQPASMLTPSRSRSARYSGLTE